MRIAIFTKCEETSHLLTQLFQLYRQQRRTELTYRCFENELDLLCDIVPGEYDALFFDGQQHESVLDELRQRDQYIRFLYLVPKNRIAGTPSISAWYCLPQPIDAIFLFPALDMLLAELNQTDTAGIVIKTKGSVLRLLFSQIECVEVLGRRVIFRLTNGRTEAVTGTLADHETRLLQWPDFFKVHRAYLCNLRYIAKLEPDHLITTSGYTMPVSKHIYPQLRKDYLNGLMLPDSSENKPPSISSIEPVAQSGYSILLVDDEESERIRWSSALLDKGCRVYTAENENSALSIAANHRVDCVVLDVLLREGRSFDLCKALQERTGAPVIYLSNLADNEHQERGFVSGGIDYITKDASRELFWMKVETRIAMATKKLPALCSGSLRLDLRERRAFVQGQALALTAVEFDLFYLLMQNPGTAYPPDKLYELIWSGCHGDSGHIVQMHLSRLCRKLEQLGGHKLIESVWGVGYRFVPEPSVEEKQKADSTS